METEKDGVKQKMADSGKLNTLVEFMKCFPLLIKRDKNTSSGMNFVMANSTSEQKQVGNTTGKEASGEKSRATQNEVEYVRHLMSLVLTRMEDKHRNITDVFRWMDVRGKGKVKKADFIQSVERARISLAREDVVKVWNYIDAK